MRSSLYAAEEKSIPSDAFGREMVVVTVVDVVPGAELLPLLQPIIIEKNTKIKLSIGMMILHSRNHNSLTFNIFC